MKQDKQGSKGQRKAQVIKNLRELVPQWSKVKQEQVELKRMAGITNETYKISHPDMKQSVLYREFGDADDNIFLNRETQEFIYQYVSDHRMGPKIIGLNEDIRIQQYIQSHVLKTSQMLKPDIIPDVAYTLRRFHGLNPSEQVSKQSLFSISFFGHDSPILSKCNAKMAKPIFSQEEQKSLEQLKTWIKKEQIQFLKKATQKFQESKLVFSHNDLLAGNILIRDKDKKIIFIDYEYSTFNYPVYDMANYFNECSIEYEVDHPPFFKYVDRAQQKEKMLQEFLYCYAIAGGLKHNQFKQKLQQKVALTEEQAKLVKDIKSNFVLGQMLSNIMWGWWAVIVCKNPNIQFDYIKFALQRKKQYFMQKEKFLNDHKNN